MLVTLQGGSTNELNEEMDPVRVMTTGTLSVSGDVYTLTYQETQQDEGDGSVMTQDIQLTLTPQRVEMTRFGDFGTSMVFMKDHRFEGQYHTPYGSLDMAVFATTVHCNLTPTHGRVHLQYQLDIQGGFAAMHELRMEYIANDTTLG